MKNKGFTLIELLAVIVILAIIALIATPIILGIIKDAKEESNKRSIDMYADAVKNAIAKYQFYNPNAPTEFKDIKDYIEYDGGNVVCDTSILFSNGNFYLNKCSVNNVPVENYSYGNASTLIEYINKLYNPTEFVIQYPKSYNIDMINGLINDRFGDMTSNLNDGNIRYFGSNPNNYIDIGDKDSNGNPILWRIVGLFKNVEKSDGSKEDLIKIVRNDSIGNYSWDYKKGKYNSQWSSSSLQTLLNEGFYNSKNVSYNNDGNQITVDFKYDGISSNIQNKIQKVKWKLGASAFNDYVERAYEYDNKEYTIWDGKIGLLYISDYGYSVDLTKCYIDTAYYSNSSCKENNWLYNNDYQWLLSTYSSTRAAIITSSGAVEVYYDSGWFENEYGSGFANTNLKYETKGVRPTMYLTSDLILVGGEGTKQSPYLVIN